MGLYGFAGIYLEFGASDDLLGLDPGGASRLTSGFYGGQSEPRDCVVGHPDGFGDGTGVVVRGGGRVLGGAVRQGRGGDRRIDGVAVEFGVCGWIRTSPFDHRDGGAPDRGEGFGGSGGGGSASDRHWRGDVDPVRSSVLDLRAAVAGIDGGFARNCGDGVRLCADRAGRLRGGVDAVPEQRDLPRGRRCGGSDAVVVGIEHHQLGARSMLDFRLGAVPEDGGDGSSAGSTGCCAARSESAS